MRSDRKHLASVFLNSVNVLSKEKHKNTHMFKDHVSKAFLVERISPRKRFYLFIAFSRPNTRPKKTTLNFLFFENCLFDFIITQEKKYNFCVSKANELNFINCELSLRQIPVGSFFCFFLDRMHYYACVVA